MDAISNKADEIINTIDEICDNAQTGYEGNHSLASVEEAKEDNPPKEALMAIQGDVAKEGPNKYLPKDYAEQQKEVSLSSFNLSPLPFDNPPSPPPPEEEIPNEKKRIREEDATPLPLPKRVEELPEEELFKHCMVEEKDYDSEDNQ